MHKINKAVILFALSFLFYSCSGETYDIHIENVTVVDLENKKLLKADVLINGKRIVKVNGDSPPPRIESKNRLDGTGKFLIPGLWDSHVHLIEEANYKAQLSKFVQFGITSVRDAGGDLDSLKKWDLNISKGVLTAPDIYYAGPTLNGPKKGDAAYTITLNDTTKAKTWVDSLQEAGVDFIKVHDRVETQVLEIIIREAHKHNLPVAGHVPFGTTIVEASNLGMDSFEHISALIAAAVKDPHNKVNSLPQAYQYVREESEGELSNVLHGNGTFVTPTLVNYKYLVDATSDESTRQAGRRGLKVQQDIVKMMHSNGVALLAGTDFGIPELEMPAGKTLIEELELLSEAGMGNYELLKMGTLNPAKFFDVDNRVGLIKPGYIADLVLLERNPVERISNLNSVLLVIQKGDISKTDAPGPSYSTAGRDPRSNSGIEPGNGEDGITKISHCVGTPFEMTMPAGSGSEAFGFTMRSGNLLYRHYTQ